MESDWRQKYIQLQISFEEFKESSHAIETELEEQLSQAHGELEVYRNRLEQKTKLLHHARSASDVTTVSANQELVTLQERNKRLEASVSKAQELQRQHEQEIDDLQRQTRILKHEVEELEHKLENEAEQLVLMTHESEETNAYNNNLIEDLQNEIAELRRTLPDVATVSTTTTGSLDTLTPPTALNRSRLSNASMDSVDSVRRARRHSFVLNDAGTQTQPQPREVPKKWDVNEIEMEQRVEKSEMTTNETKYDLYAISTDWMERWRDYISGGGENPGPIDNHIIADNVEGSDAENETQYRLSNDTRVNLDYVQVSTNVWRTLYELYGGGPLVHLKPPTPAAVAAFASPDPPSPTSSSRIVEDHHETNGERHNMNGGGGGGRSSTRRSSYHQRDSSSSDLSDTSNRFEQQRLPKTPSPYSSPPNTPMRQQPVSASARSQQAARRRRKFPVYDLNGRRVS